MDANKESVKNYKAGHDCRHTPTKKELEAGKYPMELLIRGNKPITKARPSLAKIIVENSKPKEKEETK